MKKKPKPIILVENSPGERIERIVLPRKIIKKKKKNESNK